MVSITFAGPWLALKEEAASNLRGVIKVFEYQRNNNFQSGSGYEEIENKGKYEG